MAGGCTHAGGYLKGGNSVVHAVLMRSFETVRWSERAPLYDGFGPMVELSVVSLRRECVCSALKMALCLLSTGTSPE